VEAEVDRVEAQAVDAAVEPEAHVVERGLLHVAVVEIEVGLRGQEVVQVVLLPARVPLPRRAAEDREPVVRRRAVGARVGPHVPVGLRVVAALPALVEPGVLHGAVAQHLVDHHLEAEPVRLVEHAVEILERAEQRIDRAVVRDVVAEVVHRRAEERRDPDAVHAQARHVRQLFEHARQVAHAVAGAIHEAARVDLVDHRAAPPRLSGFLAHRRLEKSARGGRV
jgi:hypothetical protein